MKKLMTTIALILLIWMFLWCVLLIYRTARAEEAHELVPVRITGYCLKGRTASGIETQSGICAYRREDIGKTANIYNANMELIGTFLIADTGRKGGAIRRGEAVDIWKETRAECFALTQNGFIEVVEPQEGVEADDKEAGKEDDSGVLGDSSEG